MAIKGIVCIGAHGAMGYKGKMPWGDKPLDGKHFRSLTEGHIVVMGRKTFESMGSKPLPYRTNVVLSSKIHPEVVSVNCVPRVLAMKPQADMDGKDIWIIGGAKVFEAFLPYIEEMYVTTVGDEFEGDVYFPDMFAEYIWNHELLETQHVHVPTNAGYETVEPDDIAIVRYMLHFRKFVKVMKKPEPAPKQERGFLL